MSPSSVLLFDLGGVLVRTRGFASIKELLADSGRPEAGDDQLLRDKWLGSPSVRDFELGRIDASVFTTRFVKEWELTVPEETFLADLAGWIESPYPVAEELLAALSPNHRLCCFSNCNELHWAMMTSLLQRFDQAFSSRGAASVGGGAGRRDFL
jgi:phosphoglycolate phosphatase-like HAD superfamily hydrolase